MAWLRHLSRNFLFVFILRPSQTNLTYSEVLREASVGGVEARLLFVPVYVCFGIIGGVIVASLED